MSFYKISEQILNNAFTENGDKAYLSTGSACLDFFSIVGAMRYNLKDALNLFMRSYFEDPVMTIKILFYVRDIRNGLGERNLFRCMFNALANMYPEVAKQLIKYVPEYGRYDDLLVCLDSPIKKDVVIFIKNQLEEDIENKNNNKPISLLAKWLPSINTSNDEVRDLASCLARNLGMTKEKYRKTLSFLRKGVIIENNLREKDYTFKYENVTSGAMFKYRDAFYRNDNERFNQYLSDLSKGKTKMNTSALYPYEVIRRLENGSSVEERNTLDMIWKNFDRTSINSKTIVVRDGSGSMQDGNSVSASSVATSLAILFAEMLTGEFKDTFITFSSRPEIVKIKGNTIFEKFNYISTYDDYTNTNIEKVYRLILDVYNHPNFSKEDELDRIVIISDMEFDEGVDVKKTTFEYFKELFEKNGYKFPEVVFWNVRARSIHFPVVNSMGVKLVSGASPKIIEMVTSGEFSDTYQFMIKCLEKYSCFDEIIIK